MKVFCFDSETGGLDPEKHSVFSVGVVVGDLESGQIIQTFEALHKLPSLEDYKYTAKAVEIHGITPQRAFEDGLTTQEIADKFMDLWQLAGRGIMGGHNVRFDVDMIARGIYNITPQQFIANFTYRFVDTLPIMRLFTGNENIPPGSTLTQAIKALNIDMSEFGKNKFHAALFDSICCFKIMHKFRKVLTQPDVVGRLIA